MKDTLLVCSKSTRYLLQGFSRARVITGASTVDILDEEGSEDSVVAIGGGAVMDTAKILSSTPITCYPTTASGSTATSWSVYWDGPLKHSLKRMKPQKCIFDDAYCTDMPVNVVNDTICDVICHCLDSDNSKKANDESKSYTAEALNLLGTGDMLSLLNAGHIAGKAIEITGTNLLHSLSYPLTGHYNITHGTALGVYLRALIGLYDIEPSFKDDILSVINTVDKSIDYDKMIDEGFKYDKMNESEIIIDKEDVKHRMRALYVKSS